LILLCVRIRAFQGAENVESNSWPIGDRDWDWMLVPSHADKNQVIEFVHTSDGTVIAKETFDTQGRGTGGVNDPLEAQGH
jgi:hypothetical protein